MHIQNIQNNENSIQIDLSQKIGIYVYQYFQKFGPQIEKNENIEEKERLEKSRTKYENFVEDDETFVFHLTSKDGYLWMSAFYSYLRTNESKITEKEYNNFVQAINQIQDIIEKDFAGFNCKAEIQFTGNIKKDPGIPFYFILSFHQSQIVPRTQNRQGNARQNETIQFTETTTQKNGTVVHNHSTINIQGDFNGNIFNNFSPQ